MENAFRTLIDLATDPFAQIAAMRDGRRRLVGSNLTNSELALVATAPPTDAECVANGDFASCETCIDPGGDPDPFG